MKLPRVCYRDAQPRVDFVGARGVTSALISVDESFDDGGFGVSKQIRGGALGTLEFTGDSFERPTARHIVVADLDGDLEGLELAVGAVRGHGFVSTVKVADCVDSGVDIVRQAIQQQLE